MSTLTRACKRLGMTLGDDARGDRSACGYFWPDDPVASGAPVAMPARAAPISVVYSEQDASGTSLINQYKDSRGRKLYVARITLFLVVGVFAFAMGSCVYLFLLWCFLPAIIVESLASVILFRSTLMLSSPSLVVHVRQTIQSATCSSC